VIPEEGASTENPNAVKKLVFCSGKVYYDLKKARNEKNLDKDVAIARVEQVLLTFFCCKGYLEQIFEILKLLSY
jgi:2-oxoglutarate dehydrogenase complex dehydrogenase (E1) component-like enzyme